MKLYSYWRSSAAYRVRIALNLKQLEHEIVACDLVAGAHRRSDYLDLNPQGLVPALVSEGQVLTQSLAIIEYLEERFPQPPLLPADSPGRARVRAMAQSICCDIHPLNNLRVLKYLKNGLGQDQEAISAWYAHWIAETFSALEHQAEQYSAQGEFLYGSSLTLADACLVPQVYNARRFGVDLDPYPLLGSVSEQLESRPEFRAAAPEQQADSPSGRVK
jgi:maleylacetoacetate isomerase/maleylpyruvate isomerase